MTLSIQDAQIRLASLIHDGKPGDRIAIEENGRVVASLVVEERPVIRKSGFLKGKIRIISDDDEHLADFKEYME
jgi:antitoxin (DNA-binding transcriptional repressor) of toxin-antitoxin stability system